MHKRFLIPLLSLVLAAINTHAEVIVSGVSSELSDNVLAHLQIDNEACDAPAWRLQQRRKNITEQVQLALQAFGYYQADIQQRFEHTTPCWNLTININLGDQVRIRTIDIQALSAPKTLHPKLQQLIQSPPLTTGSNLNHSAYDNYKNRLLDTAKAWGYWQARFERSELAVYPNDLAADIHLYLFVGPRYSFGATQYHSNMLDDDLIERISPSLEGEAYSSTQLQDMYDDLRKSGYFKQVLVRPIISEDADDTVAALDADLVLDSRHSFGAGAGYSSDQGLRARTDYQNRYLNRRGHKLRVDVLYSDPLQELTGTYTVPGKNATKEWYELGSGYTKEVTSSYISELTTAAVRAIRALPHDWVVNGGLNLRNESYLIASELDTKVLLVPGLGVSWVSRDERVRQRKGFRVEAGATVSHRFWRSDLNYLQLSTRAKTIFPLAKKGRFIVRADIAETLIKDFTELPPSVRFFTGGDNTVRGYDYNSLGEVNSNGEVIGGRRLLVGSVEYDHQIFKSWSLSIFADAGDAFDEAMDVKSAGGLGLRWYSPVGPFRFDLAFPDTGESNYRIHISVGADI